MVGLTRPVVDQIAAEGGDGDTEIVVRNERLSVEQPTESPISEVNFGQYDPVLGVMTLTLYNGEQITVAGFPTASAIPPGPTGPQGLPGKNGTPGKNGKNGMPGAGGCIGPPGTRGPTGPIGIEGREGAQGIVGLRGIQGPQGEAGPVGPTGPIGFPGFTGPRGAAGEPGPPGTPGPDGSINIVVSNTDPGSVRAGTLWVNPSATIPVSAPTQEPYIPPAEEDPISDPPIGTPWP